MLEGSQTFIVETYNTMRDHLVVQLQRKSEAVRNILDLFKCILPDPGEYSDTDPASTVIQKLIEMYSSDDTDTNYLEDELHLFLCLVN